MQNTQIGDSLDWYQRTKFASGQFKISQRTRAFIDYVVSEIRKNWENSSVTVEEWVPLEFLCSLDIYTPTNDSPLTKLFGDRAGGSSVKIFVDFKIQPFSEEKTEIEAEINGEMQNPEQPVVIKVDAWVNDIVYNQIASQNSAKLFDRALIEIPSNLPSVIEHEIVHIARFLLGYDSEGNYVAPVGGNTEQERENNFLKYVGQPKERETMYTNLYNMLMNSVKQKDQRAYDGKRLAYSMYVAMKKYYPAELSNFQARVIGLLNKIDPQISDKSESFIWKAIKQKVIDVIRGNLEVE
jgi:hypothetical protein